MLYFIFLYFFILPNWKEYFNNLKENVDFDSVVRFGASIFPLLFFMLRPFILLFTVLYVFRGDSSNRIWSFFFKTTGHDRRYQSWFRFWRLNFGICYKFSGISRVSIGPRASWWFCSDRRVCLSCPILPPTIASRPTMAESRIQSTIELL